MPADAGIFHLGHIYSYSLLQQNCYTLSKRCRLSAFMIFKTPYTIFPLGDAALTIDFGNVMDEAINESVLCLFRQLKAHKIEGVTDLVPAYSTLTVYYDLPSVLAKSNGYTAYETMVAHISQVMNYKVASTIRQQKKIKVPVCYTGDFAPDIAALAHQKSLSVEEVIKLHTARLYKVYMIGFLPGFAYMGKVNERIAVPRKPQPRFKVEGGSVGIAGFQTGIYPMASPGGWQIIGRTPLLLFNKEKKAPVLLQPGDEVQFFSIGEDEFTNY
jgi:inhibitor of KinA